MDLLPHGVASSPVVASSSAIFMNVEILWVVNIAVGASLNTGDDLTTVSYNEYIERNGILVVYVRQLTRGSRSSNIALGMYLVSSDCTQEIHVISRMSDSASAS